MTETCRLSVCNQPATHHVSGEPLCEDHYQQFFAWYDRQFPETDTGRKPDGQQ